MELDVFEFDHVDDWNLFVGRQKEKGLTPIPVSIVYDSSRVRCYLAFFYYKERV